MPFNRRIFLAGAGAAEAQTCASAQRSRVELGAISGGVSRPKQCEDLEVCVRHTRELLRTI